MDPEVMREVIEKLGIATSEVYQIYTEVQPLFGIKDIVSILLIVPLSIIVAIYTFKKLNALEGDSDVDVTGIFLIMSVFVGVITAMIISLLLDGVFNGLIKIYYPEYFAIKEILSTVR